MCHLREDTNITADRGAYLRPCTLRCYILAGGNISDFTRLHLVNRRVEAVAGGTEVVCAVISAGYLSNHARMVRALKLMLMLLSSRQCLTVSFARLAVVCARSIFYNEPCPILQVHCGKRQSTGGGWLLQQHVLAPALIELLKKDGDDTGGNIDMVAMGCTHSPEDVLAMRTLLKSVGRADVRILSVLETLDAVQNVAAIARCTDALELSLMPTTVVRLLGSEQNLTLTTTRTRSRLLCLAWFTPSLVCYCTFSAYGFRRDIVVLPSESTTMCTACHNLLSTTL